eukprot:403355252
MSQSFYDESPGATLSRADLSMYNNSQDQLTHKNPGTQMLLNGTNKDLNDQYPQTRERSLGQNSIFMLPTQEATTSDKFTPFSSDQFQQEKQQIFQPNQNQNYSDFSWHQGLEPQFHYAPSQLNQEYEEQDSMSFDEFVDQNMLEIYSQQDGWQQIFLEIYREVAQVVQNYDDQNDGPSLPPNINSDLRTSLHSSQQWTTAVAKNDDIQQTNNNNSISQNTPTQDILQTSESQDREKEEQIDFTKFITVPFEDFDNTENISEKEYLKRVKENVLQLTNKRCSSKHQILSEELFFNPQSFPLPALSSYEAQLQKFANKKIKLENYKSVLLGFLRNAKIPITFCGNDYFNKATKKIRNQFFELEIVKRVWNQIMEQATEEELFQGSSIYEEHIETFKKISAEFLTYRYPLMLPQWWYQKFEPLVQVPKKIFKKTRS